MFQVPGAHINQKPQQMPLQILRDKSGATVRSVTTFGQVNLNQMIFKMQCNLT